MTVLTFGKHKGSDVSALPEDYLKWGAEKLSSPQWKKAFSEELKKRGNLEKTMRDRLKADLSDSAALKWFERKFFLESERDIDESGCEWEYRSDHSNEVAAGELEALLAEIKEELRVESVKAKYQELCPALTDRAIKMIEHSYLMGDLDRAQFSTKERYDLALAMAQEIHGTFEERNGWENYV